MKEGTVAELLAPPASSDLTFITNERGRTLADRFSALLGNNTRLFDCLVGYFYLSGFRRLAKALSATERVRVLIGLKLDRSSFELLSRARDEVQPDMPSHAQAKERMPGEILAELESVEDSEEVESGVREFIEWVKAGKLKVRVFPSAKVHAKLYIMTSSARPQCGSFDSGGNGDGSRKSKVLQARSHRADSSVL